MGRGADRLSGLLANAMTPSAQPPLRLWDISQVLRPALPELCAGWPILSLAIFGSRARGDARPDSDLDVLAEFARPVPMSTFLALEARLAEITGLRVDLVSAGGLRPYIGDRIQAEAIRL